MVITTKALQIAAEEIREEIRRGHKGTPKRDPDHLDLRIRLRVQAEQEKTS
jgi:hypothetical protein